MARAEPALEHGGAEPACGVRSPWVFVERIDGLGASFKAAVLAQLRAGLRGQALEACLSEQTSTEPRARVSLHRQGQNVVIEVRRDERVLTRRVALSSVPADGRALAVAVATDELIRASLEQTETPDEPAPEVTAEEPLPEVHSSPPRVAEKRKFAGKALGARLATERYHGGQRTLGFDVAGRYALTRPLFVRVAFGARELERVRAPNGAITGSALGVAGGLELVLLRLGPLRVSADASLWASRVFVTGDANAGARGSERARWFAVARAGLSSEVELTPWLGLEFRAGVGAPLGALRIQDTGRTETALSGLEVHASFGPNVTF